ncbi:hypothetical protein COCCADRAFT_23478 [Bipolaris zeicola 26-R-13]|uniref:Secreted protein n=1 Tax=Cochliobolus carbonum (strain 26-R-13) TaxID=930089 RepID=W6YH92_COCC2|nr:uncharacterized protein COCCADRAFT_23478 [Bipolaris zeicola 26-R-13]EUC36885.1 hypothetical protein COCCADRAFT_23478 [Bipolaris zeicola 26-R-13]
MSMCQLFLALSQPAVLGLVASTNLQPFERMAPKTANLGRLAGFSHCSRFAARVAAGATRRPRCLSMLPVALIAMCSSDGRVTAGWAVACPSPPSLPSNTHTN